MTVSVSIPVQSPRSQECIRMWAMSRAIDLLIAGKVDSPLCECADDLLDYVMESARAKQEVIK